MNSVITHNKWKFDNCGSKAIYSNYDKVESKNDKYFKKYEDDIQINLNNSNELSVEYFRKAGVIHKLIRSMLRSKIKSSVSFLQLVNEANLMIKKFNKSPDEIIGFAFPLGISVNEIGAHDSAMVDDDRILKKNDIVKIDLGIHVNGCIVDSAFTMIVDGDDDFINMYNPLLESTADATYSGIRMAGPDALLKEISEEIKEVIESYELEDGRPISAVWGIGGHNILPYKVHGGKLILCVPHDSQNGIRMLEDEVYAIETFASTGNGKLTQKNICACNHFMLNDDAKFANKIERSTNSVVSWVANKNSNLPFTQLWCSEIKNSKENLNKGIKENVIIPFPPLCDKNGTYTSQLEHTIHIKKNGVEIFTLGNDY